MIYSSGKAKNSTTADLCTGVLYKAAAKNCVEQSRRLRWDEVLHERLHPRRAQEEATRAETLNRVSITTKRIT